MSTVESPKAPEKVEPSCSMVCIVLTYCHCNLKKTDQALAYDPVYGITLILCNYVLFNGVFDTVLNMFKCATKLQPKIGVNCCNFASKVP